MIRKAVILGGGSLLGVLAIALPASATPYGFASNQITGIAIQGVVGGAVVSITPTASSAQGATSATYGGFAPSGFNASGAVGTSVDASEATAGPGPFPGQNNYTNNAGRTAGMVGARADSSISAGVAGTVSASSVAEAFGGSGASGTGKNTASVNITFTVTAGEAVRVSFSDQIFLEASTALANGESSNATIKNDFTIRDSNGNVVFSFTPTGAAAGDAINGTAMSDPFNANASAQSLQNQPADQIISNSGAFQAQSNALPTGLYTISIDDISSVQTTPGTPVPEPAGFAVLAIGLSALGFLRMRRNTGS